MVKYHPSIRFKIFIAILLVAIIPLGIVASMIFIQSEEALILQSNKILSNRLDKTINQVDSDLWAAEAMLDLVMTDAELERISSLEEKFTKEEKIYRYGIIRDLFQFFSRRMTNFNILSGDNSFSYYLMHQETMIDSKTTYYEDVNVGRSDFIQAGMSEDRRDTWFFGRPTDYYALSGSNSNGFDERIMIYTKASGGEPITGILSLNVDLDYFRDLYEEIGYGDDGIFILLDEQMNVITLNNHMDLSLSDETMPDVQTYIVESNITEGDKNFYRLDHADGEVFVTYMQSSYTGWYYIYVVAADNVVGKISELRTFLQYMMLAVTGGVLLVTFILSRIFYRPLKKLLTGMRRVGAGELDVEIVDRRQDELHMIFLGFNAMVKDLQNLVDDLAKEKILTKDAEIQLLQAQINPHFLYNTLDSIYNIALIEEVEVISHLVEAMSRFFRISLSEGRSRIPLKEAVSLTKYYMTIQNIRFDDRIVYSVDMKAEYESILVPKFILQPIVENAVIHGLEDNNHEGFIHVMVQEAEKDIIITVTDDGVGMSSDKLEEVMSVIGNKEDSGRFFALRNIHRQLVMHYGEGYGLTVKSVAYEGTEVRLRLPKEFSGGILNDTNDGR